ncbi:SusC/RagA family TonB-linked outer membrane protein [Pedobacter sp. AW31-3R]|uniref:SusC/RagA family TonB-linked outer membrane protein n=1 Tax=Pedobacter sp. AW31-3R TaxID=3445781 RepID=UPI003F9F1310
MKLSFQVLLILLVSAQLLVASTLKGQNLNEIRIKIDFRNVSLTTAIQKIQRKTQFRFAFKESDLSNMANISLPNEERSFKATLDLLFKNQGIAYTQVENSILLFKKSAAAESGMLQQEGSGQSALLISGKTQDEKGLGLIGVSVKEKGTSNGTTTDANGFYRLNVSTENAILVFSYIGYTTKEVTVGTQKNITVVLTEDKKLLNDVVVIGYGTVKKKDATGAISTINPDGFNKGSQINAQDALLGKIAGVNITPGSGAPGDGGTIRIRSGSSLSASNDPLIVIDGVPIDNTSIQGSSNILGIINPNDIESYTVLKDASSTAIYGSRASNGVIIITTKKGSRSGAMALNYSNNFTTGSITKKIDVLNGDEYRAFITTHNAASPTVIAGLGTANTDWQDEVFRTSFGQEHNLGISGNLKAIPYRISLGYNNQNGIIKTNNYERFTGSLNLSPTFLDNHLKVNMNVKGSHETNRDADENVLASVLTFDPTRPVFESNANNYGLGYFTWLSSTGTPLTIADANPVAALDLRNSTSKINRSIGNASIDYKIHGLEDLRFNLNLGYDVLKSKGHELIEDNAPATYVAVKKDGQGLDHTYTQKKDNQLMDFYANYTKQLGIHNLDVLVGYGWQHFTSSLNDTQLNRRAEQLFDPTHYESENYLISFYGRLNYSIASKYLFTATLRSDGSSRFTKENRWGYFPSAAFAWRMNQEDFMKNSTVVSDLKLRLSYGQTGQQDIGSDYPALSTYTASYNNSRYQLGDEWYTTYRPNGYDPNIKWETNETFNLGLDFGFLNNRITGSVDAYRRNTTDLLNQIPVAAGSNLATEIYTNVGSMKNSGIEFAINTVPVSATNFKWEIGANISHSKSEITKLNTIDAANYGVMIGPVSGTGKTVQIHSVGYAPYTFYLAQQAYDEQGQPIEGQYVQPDGSVSSTATLVRNHSATPSTYLGLTSRFTYKQWDLGFNAHAAFGHSIYNYVAANDHMGSVYEANTYKNIQQSTMDSGFEAEQLYSDYFLENGNFFRMDNITLGYTFPKIGKRKSSLSISAAVQNVFVITKYSGLDPEAFYRSGSTSYLGIDKNLYPRPRVFMAGLKFNY